MGDTTPRAGSTALNKTKADKGNDEASLAAAKAMESGIALIKADIEAITEQIPDISPLREQIKSIEEGLKRLEDAGPVDNTEVLDNFKQRMDLIEQVLQSPGGAKAQRAQTVGQIIHSDKDFQQFLKTKGSTFSHEIKGQSQSFKNGGGSIAKMLATQSGSKATILGATELEDMSYDARRSAIVSDPEESVDGFIPMIPGVPMPGAETYRYRKETAKSLTGYVHTTLAVEIDGDPTAKTTCTFTSVDGFVAGTYVRFFAASGTERKQIVSINTSTKVVTFDTDDLDFDAAVGIDITSEQFGATAESGTKPYGYLEMTQETVNLKTLAELIGVTQQRLNAAQTLDAWIRQKLPMRMRRNIAWHLLYGDDDNANELAGFSNDDDVQTYTWSTDGVVGDNLIDAILAAKDLVVGENCTFVINKIDLRKMRKLKDSTGQYLMATDFGRIPFERVGSTWVLDGYPIILSDAVIPGDFFVIDFAEASELLDQQSSELSFGWIDAQFAKNEITVRYEETLAHAILSTAAYVYGTWDAAPS